MVAWREPQPGGKLATASELVALPDCRSHCRGGDRPDTGDSLQELRLPAEASLNAHRDLVTPKPIMQGDQLSAENAQNVLGELRQISLSSFYDPFHEIDGPRNGASDGDAKLRHQAAKHVDQLSALADYELPCV